jgi:hypothetical protein
MQYPQDKPNTALILYSIEKGVGKSTLFLIFRAMLGVSAQVVPEDIAKTRFNFSFGHCLLGFMDDMAFQLKKDSEKFRSLVSAEFKNVEPKGVDSFELKDYTRYLVTSNHKHIVDVDIVNKERRYTLLEIKDSFAQRIVPTNATAKEQERLKEYNKQQSKRKVEYFQKLYALIDESAEILLAYFLRRKITSNLRMMYTTALYNEVATANLSKIDAYFTDIKYRPKDNLLALYNVYDAFLSNEINAVVTESHVVIKKQRFKEVFVTEYDPRATTHSLNQQLRDSKLATLSGIDYTGRGANTRVWHKFGDDTKYSDAIKIPITFFENF